MINAFSILFEYISRDKKTGLSKFDKPMHFCKHVMLGRQKREGGLTMGDLIDMGKSSHLQEIEVEFVDRKSISRCDFCNRRRWVEKVAIATKKNEKGEIEIQKEIECCSNCTHAAARRARQMVIHSPIWRELLARRG